MPHSIFQSLKRSRVLEQILSKASYKATFLIVSLLFISYYSSAQKKNASYQLKLKPASSEINIDGIAGERTWKEASIASNFYMVQPMDTSFANVRTDVMMSYDNENLYIIAICYHEPGPYFVESLRRDFSFNKNDNFLMFLDPFDDKTNGFSFGSNAAGAQWDGIMYDGSKIDLSWDNKWVSAVKNYEDRWIFEAAIPFKSIRYKVGITEWGINFSRLDLKSTEKSSWAPVPRQFPTASLAYTGNLIWNQPPPTPGQNISVIPYLLGGVSNDHLKSPVVRNSKREVGGDVKVAVTSSLNLDLTVNPDYSQVEVDRQIPNLDRFELFFPERRQYFLENGDLFSNYGYGNIRPFFSRRIGLGVPIQFGARLSGKLNKDWRIGLMDMQTAKVGNSLPAQNFAVMSLQRRVFARSSISALFINKQSMEYLPAHAAAAVSKYNRNAGLEYNLASPTNTWTGKAVFMKSFSPGRNGNDFMQAASLNYISGNWNIGWQHEIVGRNYNAEVGYVPRTGYINLNPQAAYLFFPKKGNLVSHGPKIVSWNYFDQSFKRTDNTTFLAYNINFRSRATFSAWAAADYVKLLSPFDPTNLGGATLPTGSEHHWQAWGTDFVSRPQSMFTYAFSTRYGGYYADGTRLNISSELGYRFQPYVSLALSSSYNDIKLPLPWDRTTFWLVGPRLDVTMTNKLFFTGFVQYNEQRNNLNINTRLQWRYKPASDLFIVYTDNYLPNPLSVKNRFLVLKLTYWWNI